MPRASRRAYAANVSPYNFALHRPRAAALPWILLAVTFAALVARILNAACALFFFVKQVYRWVFVFSPCLLTHFISGAG